MSVGAMSILSILCEVHYFKAPVSAKVHNKTEGFSV